MKDDTISRAAALSALNEYFMRNGDGIWYKKRVLAWCELPKPWEGDTNAR